MSYLGQETSEYAGQPVELYKFTLGSQEWNYCSGDADQSYLGRTYLHEQIGLDDNISSTEVSRAERTLTAPRDLPLAQLFVKMLPAGVITLDVFRRHLTDGGLETILGWTGVVVGSSFKAGGVEMRGVPLINVMTRLGVRRQFQVSCNHMLYDPDTCRLNPDDYKTIGPITVINGSTYSAAIFAAQASGYYTGGFLRRPSNGDMRMIVGHTGGDVQVWFPFEDMVVFETIEAYAGCDHSDITCLNKFNNLVNNGGWPLVPIKNPAEQKFA
jgi:uncharacterized phage protein (TIGR02218 family)